MPVSYQVNEMERNQRKQFYHCKGIERSELMEALLTYIYYSFKIFPRFRLAKSTLIIYHNQLLMTKFGRILRLNNR